MKKATLGKRLSRGTVVAMALALPLGSVTAYADSDSSSNSKFVAKYQQNAQIEAQLLAQAQASNVTNSQIVALRNQVTFINQQIATLYASEQQLLAQSAKGTNQDATLQNLIKQRDALLAKLNAAWKTVITVQTGKGHGDERDDAHGDKHRGETIVKINTKEVQQTARALAQVQLQINRYMATHRQGDDRRDRDNRDNDMLANLQASILKLQQAAIEDIRLWIRLEGSNPGNNGGGQTGVGVVTGLSVTANVNVAYEGAPITYSVQLVDAHGTPVKQSGVKIDFGFVGSNNDGTLSAGAAYTDANGVATVNVQAGNQVGGVQVVAKVDGQPNIGSTSTVTSVIAQSSAANHLVLTSGQFPTSLSSGQSTGGGTFVVLPENASNQFVVGDRLQVTTSNPQVLSLQAPDTANGNVETLPVNTYTLPTITAKSAGQATITITDISAPNHPSLSYGIQVAASAPVKLVAINPNGTINTSFNVTTAGVVGPFSIATEDAFGNIVPATHDITLSAAQVAQIVGTGTGVRVTPSAPDVIMITIPAGQSSVAFYVDNAAAGNTNPHSLLLNQFVPEVSSVTVKDNHTIAVTFSQALDSSSAPLPGDFVASWATGNEVPVSVSVSGNVATLSFAGAPFYHGQSIYLTYTADAHGLVGAWGGSVANFKNLTVVNGL